MPRGAAKKKKKRKKERNKLQGTLKGKKQSEETKQATEPDSGMVEVWELWDWEFKITVIKILRALTEKTDFMQEQMGNVSRQVDTLRENQKENTRT